MLAEARHRSLASLTHCTYQAASSSSPPDWLKNHKDSITHLSAQLSQWKRGGQRREGKLERLMAHPRARGTDLAKDRCPTL